MSDSDDTAGDLSGYPGMNAVAQTPAGSATRDAAVRRRLLIGGGVIVAILAIIGVVQGLLWAWVAPGEQVKVFANGSYGALPTADFHPFVDLALFVLFGIVVGLVAGAAVWQARTIRGVGALLLVAIGSAIGAALAYWIGLAVVTGVDPATVGATGKDQIVVQAPRLSTPLVILAQPAFAAAVYTFLAAWNGRSDLGRPGGPATQETPGPAPVAAPAGVTDRAGAADSDDADRAQVVEQPPAAAPAGVTEPAAGTPRTDPSPAAG